MVASMIYVEGRTDGHDESNRRFSLNLNTSKYVLYQKQQGNKRIAYFQATSCSFG